MTEKTKKPVFIPTLSGQTGFRAEGIHKTNLVPAQAWPEIGFFGKLVFIPLRPGGCYVAPGFSLTEEPD